MWDAKVFRCLLADGAKYSRGEHGAELLSYEVRGLNLLTLSVMI